MKQAVSVGVILWGLVASLPFPISSVSAQDHDLPSYQEVRDAGLTFRHINGPEKKKKYLPEAKGGGIAFLDFDGDGWLDLYVVQGSTMERLQSDDHPKAALFRNERDGTFRDVTLESGLTHRGWGMGVAAGDFDNDGHVDLYLCNLGPNVLYRNNGDGSFTDITGRAGVGDSRWSTSAAFGDYDGDGDLDLFVANYVEFDPEDLPPVNCSHRGNRVFCGPLGLSGAADVLYRNEGEGGFVEVSEETGVVDRGPLFGLGCVWSDLDGDGDLDLVVANDSTPNLLFVNRGDGTFSEEGYLSGLAMNADGLAQAGMGIDAADFDNDGLADVFITHYALEYSTLYRNRGGLLFEDVTAQARLSEPEWLLVSWGTRFVDIDHDGWKDLVHSNGHVYPYLASGSYTEKYAQPKSIYRNCRDGTFEDVTDRVGEAVSRPRVSRGMAFGDYDNDGDMDFVVANLNGTPDLYRSDLTGDHHWAMFRLIGRRSNRDGIGARIRLQAGGLPEQVWEIKRTVGIYSSSDPRAHFGVGAAERIERVLVKWPSGRIQKFEDLEVDRHYVIDEEAGLRRETFE